jgi:signal transduction histidine kinase
MTLSLRTLVLLTAAVAVVFVASAWSVVGAPDGDDVVPYVALVAANTLPLLAIGRHPLAVVVVFAVAYPLWVDSGFGTAEVQSLPTLVAMYATGAWDRPLWIRALALLAPVWMMAAAATGLWDVPLLALSYVALVFAIVWALGVVVAGRQAYATTLEARTMQLDAARRELADHAVADERARIARELHDVIAHAMSVITVQAGVAAHLEGREGSPRTVDALRVIERTGREALAEMRRMLTVLRGADGPDGSPDPQPGLADLPALVAQTRDAGVAVTVETHGPAVDLPPGLDLAAYRVVQEALTNVAKHGAGVPTTVVVAYRPRAVRVVIRNRVAEGVDAVEAGQGLRGMAERVTLYDGTLQTRVQSGELTVDASFPVPETR